MMESDSEVNEIKYSCKLGILSRPDGSAIFCQGKKILFETQQYNSRPQGSGSPDFSQVGPRPNAN